MIVDQAGPELRLDGHIVLVTGARRGLGLAYARLLAERGATLALNDLDPGDAQNAKPELARAVWIAGSAVDGGRLVEETLARTPRLDALVLNAGFLRDRSLPKSTEDDLRDLWDVHVLGPWRAIKAAWPTLKAQGHGRIVLTTSPAGLYGQFGQTAYAAAKSALVGLTRTLALEGARDGIRVNAVAPLAASRLTASVLPQPLADRLPPAAVAGLVAWLCHPDCEETGQVYEAAGGSIARHVPHRSQGVFLGREPTPEAVRDAWAEINDLDRAETPDSSTDAMLRFVRRWPDAADLGVEP